MKLLNREDIKRIFTMEDAIESDKLAFSIHSDNKDISPLRTNIQSKSENGSIIFMPGYVDAIGAAGLKIVSVFSENAKRGLPSTPGTVLLVDDKTGVVSCILDGTYVTELRTGAAAGAAISILARKESKVGALIGTGGQAESQFDAMVTAAKNLEEIRVFSATKEKRDKFAEKMGTKYNNIKVFSVDSSDLAVEGADIITLVTTSTKPVINGDKIKKGATICGVGAYMPTMCEIDNKTLMKADKIYFDSKSAVLAEAGCFINALANGEITEKNFTGEIGEVINGKVKSRESDDEIIVFKTVGFSTQDVVTAKAIYDKALENSVGYDW
ncbi:ornithine cyclodeaminase family protein [Peptostreptococcus faecalis]|uniref:ornithine cyclodeaminase family protein n=1 Tax=Peptostreptococcus faecalis TaxID=2045015 RepID=UPI000C7AF243|nr:ornithine cyclodeaminase family protein [Peptostreptococcus faecalis]